MSLTSDQFVYCRSLYNGVYLQICALLDLKIEHKRRLKRVLSRRKFRGRDGDDLSGLVNIWAGGMMLELMMFTQRLEALMDQSGMSKS